MKTAAVVGLGTMGPGSTPCSQAASRIGFSGTPCGTLLTTMSSPCTASSMLQVVSAFQPPTNRRTACESMLGRSPAGATDPAAQKLGQTRYAQPDRILSIAPNGALAASSSHIYRVSDGAALAAVPGPCPVQVFSTDSATLYCTDAGFLTSVDLRGLK